MYTLGYTYFGVITSYMVQLFSLIMAIVIWKECYNSVKGLEAQSEIAREVGFTTMVIIIRKKKA